jgi:glycosyltransferase involved in cell wall biosynthesis
LRRVTIVTHELRGFLPVGGMGTATTFLAVALARMGHSVEILLGVMHNPESIDPEWRALYDSHGIRIRPVPPNDEPVGPAHFERTYAVARALQADPPDVVVVHDLAAPAYAALRLRHLRGVLEDTLFVVFCHGTRRWVLELSRRLDARDLEHVLALNVLERMSLELADVVVSPSAYLVDWMRGHGWRLPERTLVIPYLTRSAALGDPPPVPAADGAGKLRRIAFFGRLEEKKGLTLFAAALNRLEPQLLAGIELEFVGRPTASWPPERVEQLLSPKTKAALSGISFVGDLDQAGALARLKRAGTLAVAPSLGDNSPNTVYECIEHGIPLIASDDGGIPELVAEEDRGHVLFEPTPAGMAGALQRALAEGERLRPARPAFSGDASYRAWAELLELHPEPSSEAADVPPVDVIVVRRGSEEALERCLAALEQQTAAGIRVDVADSREDGLAKGEAPYVVFLDEADLPEPGLIEALLRAQARSGADAVSCGLRTADRLQLFSGQPGGLGLLANDYGAVALFDRAALAEQAPAWPADRDADWRLLAGLTAAGRTVVSIPEPLVTRSAGVGTVKGDSGDALLAVHELERALPRPLRGMARLAAGLAANAPPRDGGRARNARIARLVLRLRVAAGRLSGPRR